MSGYRKAEKAHYRAIKQFMEAQYPWALWHFDITGEKLTVGQRCQIARYQSEWAWPDFFLAEARHGFHGMFLEIKATYEDLYTKKGIMRNTQHIIGQDFMLKILRSRGYYADFCIGIDGFMDIVNRYLEEELQLCGHSVSAIVSSDEGTNYCRMCVK